MGEKRGGWLGEHITIEEERIVSSVRCRRRAARIFSTISCGRRAREIAEGRGREREGAREMLFLILNIFSCGDSHGALLAVAVREKVQLLAGVEPVECA